MSDERDVILADLSGEGPPCTYVARMADHSDIEVISVNEHDGYEVLVKLARVRNENAEDPYPSIAARCDQMGFVDHEFATRAAAQVESAGIAKRAIEDCVAHVTLANLGGHTQAQVVIDVGPLHDDVADACLRHYAFLWVQRFAEALGLSLEPLGSPSSN